MATVDKRRSVHIPFKELEACPECGSRELKKVHNRRYPGKEGIYTVVIYRCPNGHETFSRQLDTPKPLGWYEGHYE